MKDFLFELGTEELPPKALKSLLKALAESVYQQLDAAGLAYDKQDSQIFASPRRLAMRVVNLAAQTAASEKLVWGPPANLAFDADGKPSKAALAFASKNGIAETELKNYIRNDGKADKLCVVQKTGGTAATALLPAIIEQALKDLPIPKRMRWGARKAEFVRPVHWLVMMYGNDVIPCEILEQKSGNKTRGHRFHSPDFFTITSPADYQKQLREHKVEVCFGERRKKIVAQVNAAAEKLGGSAVIDRDLLDEVTALVEWPVALVGNFEKRFLEVPQEALISSMSEHQKYFHVVDANGKLLPHFITVANLESTDPQQVVAGNERVIRPRLSDAAFFFETDKKQTLESRLPKLDAVVFHEKFGSLYRKSTGISQLAERIAGRIGADHTAALRAGLLCKADLTSKMVLEFDRMQGIAGQYYALHDGESPVVANAIREHYLPKFAGDEVPQSLEGCAVALADRIDTLVVIFSTGERPTGSKDPFALRRAAIGILNIILQKNLDLNLREQISNSAQIYNCGAQDVFEYIIERFRAMYQEQGIPAEVFNSVAVKNLDNPLDINLRVHAVHEFSKLPEAQSLAAANKRVANIFSKSGLVKIGGVDHSLFQQEEEHILAKLIDQKYHFVVPLLQQRKYAEALCSLAELRPAVDAFFDKVMVNAEDKDIRTNRFALLLNLQALFFSIADISHLVPEKK
jgi:glycyl-tRNA synthetase beta chain